jgi:NADH-quinone oxidoreductase subunit G
VKPRYNADVNQWWMCDEGRYGFGWIDEGRLTKVRTRGVDSTWDVALDAIAAELAALRQNGSGGRIGIIGSTQLTNEDLFLLRELFQRRLGARVTASFPAPPGSADDFLIKADKSPNTTGAAWLGLAGELAEDAADLLEDAREGRIEMLWVFGHDLAALASESELQELSRALRLFVFSGTNENGTASAAHWVLPTAASVEKDGTFVNCHGRVQRVGRAFPPLADSREDWRILLDLAHRLNEPLPATGPEDIFIALAAASTPFAGLTYALIGEQGAALAQAETP